MSDAHGVARDQLRAFIERVERLSEEKKTIEDDIKDVYGEAKAMGYCVKTMKKIVALRKIDDHKRTEEELILDTYKAALGMIPQIEMFDEEEAPKQTKQPPMAKASPRGDMVSEVNPRLIHQVVTGMQTETGRAALIAAVDILIEREEAEEQNAPERPSDNDEPYPEAGPQAEASPAGTGTGTLADREGRQNGEAVSADLPTHFEIAPASQGEAEAPSVDSVSATASSDANRGGEDVTPQNSSAQHQAGGLVKIPPAAKHPALLLRPNCQHPGEEICGGSGKNHCRACAAAMREEEVA